MKAPELRGAWWRKSSYSGGSEGSCVEVASVWQKSSYSGASEGQCVEVAAAWHKSSRSGGDEGDCVEVGSASGRLVAARDSKDPEGPALCFEQGEWRSFFTSIKSGVYG
ncbi:DUF397 domain-containing protein [Actinomadura barringtoniae]|uniref:DUF397 domain-containing protein n=1 Tax=Actinomadura barringtoniae TaxID=1427535 RepID=A0A939PBJ9_9ACTN|nr:DUF397 domain-containing protein [Actinomadura barringtoniae]MBO2449610.1 DUF397 domain-containing protein [Actinomadura barringtoniae]